MNNVLRSAAIALAALSLALAAAAQARFDFDTAPGRLPKAVVPARYALTLTLDPDADAFAGEAVISLRVRQPVAAIVLHASGLDAKAMSLLDGSGERRLAVQADAKAQTWTLTPADGAGIVAGEHSLRLAWNGKVRNDGSGLYRAPHQVAGKPARMLATQLEAIFARQVFPAFDEPAFRMVFDIAVRAPAGYEVLSNMNEQRAVAEGASVLHRFEPTPPMPSYLVAVAVGRFDMLAGSAAGVPLRVITAPGKGQQGAYALAATQKLLPYYNEYFGVPYALPKLDQLAVPSTRRGAMEDWGLISYAESALLFDPASSDTKTQRRIFDIVAHEVAHQWFGNLVTAASWEEIWLNEAFATWLAEKASARFNPEWQIALRRRGPIDRTMARDAGPATHAIRRGTVLEDRVFDAFDNITYVKGGAVLSMLEQWIGPENLRRGLAAYMQARSLGNATAGDLWFHIGQASGRDIAAVAASWTDQPGFPLVTVASRCDGGRTVLELAQRRFTTAPLAEATTALWQLPLRLLHDGKTSSLLLERAAQTVTLPGCPALPTLLNPGGEGFYRVAYAPLQQAALAQGLATLPATAQATLLSDSFALAQSGRLPMAAYIDLLVALPQIQGAGRPALFEQARSDLRLLAHALAGSAAEAPLQAAARALLGPELARVGWTSQAGEDSEVQALRSSLIQDLARYGDSATIERARALFDAAEAGGAPLVPALRSGVVMAVGMHADARRFEQLLARLKTAQREEDQHLYTRALAATRDAAQAKRVLELSLQGLLPTSIAAGLPRLVAQESPFGELAYAFTVEHWQALAALAGEMFGGRYWLLPGASEGMNRHESARRVVADQRRLAGAAGAMAAAQMAARIELLADVKAREAERLVGPLTSLPPRLARGGS